MKTEQSPDEPLRYRALAGRFEQGIRSGAIRPGERLPSIRQLSRSEGLSMSTVLAALRLLEQRGYAQARPQSGYFARLPARRPPPPTTRSARRAGTVSGADVLNEILDHVAGGDTLPLGAAIPAPALLPIKALARSLMRVTHRDGGRLLGSMSGAGLPDLRQAIAARMTRFGCSVHPDEVIITSGAADSVALALRTLTRRGDVIACESPTYYGLLMTAEAQGLQVLELATDPINGVSVDAFEAACVRKPPAALVVSANVQNPTGACMPEAAKRRLVAVAARYGVPLIEDDVFGDYARYGGSRCTPLKALDTEGNVLYCNSFSKVIAPGLRLGWIVAGQHHAEVLGNWLGQSWGCPPLTQQALAQLLREASLEHQLRRVVRTIDDTRSRALEQVHAHFHPATRVATPRYGFLLWLQLPPGMNGLDYYRAALRQGISVMPGFVFSPSGGCHDHIRLNLGVPWSDTLADALQRLGMLSHAIGGADDLAPSRTLD